MQLKCVLVVVEAGMQWRTAAWHMITHVSNDEMMKLMVTDDDGDV